jgi:lipopolysaccharide/colanic/teichoic acid biosynthesis glycosyltransferase
VSYQVTDAPRLPEAAGVAGRPEGGSLAERYAAIAHAYEPRPIDRVLRALDIVIALIAIVLASPFMLLMALAIRLTSGRPVLYRGARVGRYGRIYHMYKFRTLAPDAESRLGPYYGPDLTAQTEREVTRLGRIARATQLDELPQMVNVLKGDMSVVGPRPIRPVFFEELCEQIPAYWQRLVVRPGVTGFAQVRMGREETWAEKLAHDLEYIADRSLSLYLSTAAATFARLARQSLVDSVALILRRR